MLFNTASRLVLLPPSSFERQWQTYQTNLKMTTTSTYDGCEVCELMSPLTACMTVMSLSTFMNFWCTFGPDCLPTARNFSVEKAEEMLRNVCCHNIHQASFPSFSHTLRRSLGMRLGLNAYVVTCVNHCVWLYVCIYTT